MRRSTFLNAAIMVSLSVLTTVAYSQERGTKDEAKALVDRAMAHLREVGAQKAFSDFTNDSAKWVVKDMYVFAYDMSGTTLAHGANAKLVGKNMGEMRDSDGRSPPLEMGKLASIKGAGWYDYNFIHPVTKKSAPKTSYVSKIPNMDAYVGVGVYR